MIIMDANAFISSGNMLDLGANSILISTVEVLDELRDSKTRDKISNLPFEIETRSVGKKSLEFVKEFARKSGDIGSLSDVDLGIVALAYEVYNDKGLGEKLRKTPDHM